MMSHRHYIAIERTFEESTDLEVEREWLAGSEIPGSPGRETEGAHLEMCASGGRSS